MLQRTQHTWTPFASKEKVSKHTQNHSQYTINHTNVYYFRCIWNWITHNYSPGTSLIRKRMCVSGWFWITLVLIETWKRSVVLINSRAAVLWLSMYHTLWGWDKQCCGRSDTSHPINTGRRKCTPYSQVMVVAITYSISGGTMCRANPIIRAPHSHSCTEVIKKCHI